MESRKLSILIVDDEKNFRTMLSDALVPEGYDVETAEDGRKGLEKFASRHFDLAIVDVMMPVMDGLSFLKEVKAKNGALHVIMMSALNDVDNVVSAVKHGAVNFLIKPIDLDVLFPIVSSIEDQIKLNEENIELREKLSLYESHPNIVGNSPKFTSILKKAMQIARTEAFCILFGESGTGKEVICELLHRESPRNKSLLRKINCAAIPPNLLESELFGYEKGAFTGAYQTKKGLFELADKGTLFLDEIGDLDLNLQAKLLRVIELGEFTRVGGERTITSNVRIISATNKDLLAKIQEKTFREDLYYRLNVVNLTLPPLRDRVEDIPLLANHFITELCKKNKKDIRPISLEALEYLRSYPFEGNVRELKNLMERAVVFATGKNIELMDIFGEDTFKYEKHYFQVPINMPMEEIERNVIHKVLELTNGDKKKAAEMLKISVRKIFYKIKEEKEASQPEED
ncbi:MAG: sigma-54 dependent transcriptional regulator [Spirochaetota bacterium]|nr:sigma-54 dependent transcriptional regulator [Spirochaetota bacterium]